VPDAGKLVWGNLVQVIEQRVNSRSTGGLGMRIAAYNISKVRYVTNI
jgi:hypothetical protein